MPFLSAAQRKAGRELGSASAVADSKQTLLCTYLSAVLLVGLVLNATLGWSWADPIAALVIAAIAAKEGRDAWRGKGCCAPPLPWRCRPPTPRRTRADAAPAATAASDVHQRLRGPGLDRFRRRAPDPCRKAKLTPAPQGRSAQAVRESASMVSTLGTSAETSMPTSAIAATTAGLTVSAKAEPADRT